MKRTYSENYLTRNPKALLSRFVKFAVNNRAVILAVLASIILLLFVISCLLVASDAHLSTTLAVHTKKILGPDGTAPSAPGVSAVSAVLMDAESGRVLYEKNAHEKLPIASTTKMMTALVIREQLNLKDSVVISPEAASVGEQEIWLEPGETLTVKDLLYALMVQSANDAAYALAQYTTGSAQSFAKLMNMEAEKIGLRESHFTNPHGLDEPGHYSTAYDLAVIGRYLLEDPVLAKMAAAKQYEIPWPDHPYPRTALSHNEFLDRYPGATGIKTGYTLKAGWCLVASARREGKSLIAVVLNCEQRAADAGILLDYGFSSTERVVLARQGQSLGRTRVSAYPRRYVDVVPKEELAALSVKGAGDVFEVKTDIARAVQGSVKKGTTLGRIECTLNTSLIYTERVVAERKARKPGILVGIFVFIWYALCWMGRIIGAPFGLS
ncbi:MAG: D-alanyl-D-alanine carboxypeptidase [Actinobacteria bacterium]|nr:D-alanyl-D-alanine carboxypeptidase [Actinomycetota bacterium]